MLKNLRINHEGILPSFSPDITEYYLTVPENINKIDVEAIPENPNLKVEITGNDNLKIGENLITVNVTGEDEIYNIHVLKTDNYETLNNNLEVLSIENGLLDPPFDSNITEYKLEVMYDVKNLNILAVPENEDAIIEISRSIRIGCW